MSNLHCSTPILAFPLQGEGTGDEPLFLSPYLLTLTVFREAARLLKPGGRLALADIVTETQLPEGITCDATLWAACIGGAMQVEDYISAIEAAGLRVTTVQDNPQYLFISKNAQGAARKYGVKSISLVAVKN